MQVAEAHPDAFLILVGDTGSPYGEAVRSLVAAAGLQKRVLISRVVPEPYRVVRGGRPLSLPVGRGIAA